MRWIPLLLLSFSLLAFVAGHSAGIYAGQLYRGEGPEWMKQAVGYVYPRFEAEKNRLPEDFFVQKAQQVAWRAGFVAFLCALGVYFFPKKLPMQEASSLAWLRRCFAGGMLLLTWDWGLMLSQMPPAFYAPVLPFRLLGLDFPPLWAIWSVFGLYVGGLLGCMLGWRLSAALAALLFLYMNGLFQSFEKFDHGFATVQYQLMLLPLLVWEEKKGGGVSVFLMQLCVALAYLLAGMEKLWVSGLAWTDSFAGYLAQAGTPLGLWVLQNPIWVKVLPAGALLWQLTFIIIVFWPRWAPVYLLAGLFFHWGTYWLLDAGGYFSPWLLAYLPFLTAWAGRGAGK